jgi:membrane protease YdiL (CAAX protease family)
MIFRHVSYRFLRAGFPIRVAIVLQALLFSVFHLNLMQSFYVFPVAIVLGLVYEWSGSLWAPILLHVAFNSTGPMLQWLSETRSEYFSGLLFVSLLAIISILRQLYRKKTTLRQ